MVKFSTTGLPVARTPGARCLAFEFFCDWANAAPSAIRLKPIAKKDRLATLIA